MRKFKYYWLLNPVQSTIKDEHICGYHVCDSSQIVNERSSLGVAGRQFFDVLQQSTGLYNHSLWVFRNDEFQSQEEANSFSDIFRVVAESYYNFGASSPRLIIIDSNSNEIIAKQPPQVEAYQSIKIDTVNEDDLTRIFKLSEKLRSINREKTNCFFSILDYLRDIRASPSFVGELALWSFVEHYWAQNRSGNTDIYKSLKSLLEEVYIDKQDRKDFNLLVRNVGRDLGKSYDEHILRNILAHGKHMTLKENWTENNWNNFYKVHEQLISIVLIGIENKIYAA